MTKAQKRYLDLITFDGWMIGRETIEELLKRVPVGATVLELGGGVGTAVLRAFYEVITVENDPAWKGFNAAYPKVEMKDGWYSINGLQYAAYQAIIIDGPKRPYNRQDFGKHLHKFDLSVPIIVDDTEKWKGKQLVEVIEQEAGRAGETFKSKKPDKYDPNYKKFTII